MEKKYADEYNKLQEMNNKEMEELESEMNNKQMQEVTTPLKYIIYIFIHFFVLFFSSKNMKTQKDFTICKLTKTIPKNPTFFSTKKKKHNNKKWTTKES